MITPQPLRPADTVAIISPASVVREEYVSGAVRAIESHGLRARVMPAATGPACGSYAASAPARLADIMAAITDPQVKAILCARGGYGCVHLLEHIPGQMLSTHPKWLIGFSDISALHALWQKAGIVSLHAPMARHLATMPADDECSRLLFSLLTSPTPAIDYHVEPHPLDMPGTGRGRLAGGNLAVLSHLTGTPWDLLTPGEEEDVILLIEDVSEAIYATERMLWQLKLTGALQRVRGIIVGQFTEAAPDRNFPSTTAMIGSRLREWGVGCPVSACFPAGHVDRNLPLPLGMRVSLHVSASGTSLTGSC